MASAINHDATDASPIEPVPQLGLNVISRRLMLQRPALFNHATRQFRDHPELLYREIAAHPDVVRRGDALLSRQDPLPLLSTSGQFGVEYCFQIADLELEAHPRSQPCLLEPGAPPSQLALLLQVCGAIMCTAQDQAAHHAQGFSLDLLATGTASWVGPAHQRQLSIALGALEIADVDTDQVAGSPAGSACYVLTTLKVGVMPRIRMALESLVFELGQFATDAVAPQVTPAWARPGYARPGARRALMTLN